MAPTMQGGTTRSGNSESQLRWLLPLAKIAFCLTYFVELDPVSPLTELGRISVRSVSALTVAGR